VFLVKLPFESNEYEFSLGDELRVSRLAKPSFLCIVTIRLNVGGFSTGMYTR